MADRSHAQPFDDDDLARLRSLHAAGVSRNDIAREMGRSGSTVSRYAAELGLTFDRAGVQAATEARKADAAARRVSIVDRMYRRMEKVLDRLEAETFKTTLKGEYGMDEVRELDFVLTADERNLADTLSRYGTTAAKLEAIDADHGTEHAKSMLGDLMTNLSTAWHAGQPDAG